MKKILLVGLLAVSISCAQAHAPEKGKHGGQQADAGQYHVEVVASDKSLAIFIYDHSEKPVATDKFKGTAILVVDGKSERIVLSPAGENKLAGSTDAALKAPIKGVIQITNHLNGTVQAKF